MKILIVHNHYQDTGGEDAVVAAERQLLEERGHTVVLYTRSNNEIVGFSLREKLDLVLKSASWSRGSYQEIRGLIQKEKPDLVHVHNTFLLISPSVYDACYEEGVPVVQTLHNYRFLCPNGVFYRDGRICEDCLSQGLKAAVIHKCWRDSYFSSAVIAGVIREMRRRDVFTKKIRRYIALSEFSKKKFVASGFPENKISIKPNFLVRDPGWDKERDGQYALFIGALRDYKGVLPLVEAWGGVKKDFPLKIIGDGPLRGQVLDRARGKPVEGLGALPLQETLGWLKRALFLIVPSQCYETFSRVVMEAFACGVPVIAADIGAVGELVEEGRTGSLFDPVDPQDMISKVNALVDNRQQAQDWGRNARQVYEERFSAGRNYTILKDIYEQALGKTL